MASIFLSHSSQDNEVAGDLSRRLKEHGYDSLFLDFDPDSGIKAGRDWERELYRNLKLAGAVIVLCSPSSMASRWCFVEIAQAKALGKAIFPITISPCHVETILNDRQVIDLTAVGEDEAYRRLFNGLRAAGLDPWDSFHWDSKRPPFPGLNYFDAKDAGIYFGREDEVRQVIETLTRMQRQGEPRLLVVVGSSGSGKSSLVRAGVLPRLGKDRAQWAIVEPFRPGAEPIRRLAQSLALAFAEGPARPDWKAIRDRLYDESREAGLSESPAASALTDHADDLTMHRGSPEASVLLVVDQVEELLQNVASDEASAFFQVLRRATERPGGRVFGLLTLRSDFLGSFQNHPALRGLAFADLPLGLLPVEHFPQVIEGPADRAALALEPGLVGSMIADARTDDALPLLAFTLREMYERCRDQARLTLAVYRDDLGGIKGAVARVVERIKIEGTWTSEVGRALRRAFLKLVRVNDEGQFTRQPCRWADLPDLAAPVLEAFVKARLLSSNGDVVEVTHESLFRVWPELAGWLDESRELMLWKKNIQDEVKDWLAHDRFPDRLLSGARVSEARRWLASNADDFPAPETEFLAASIAAEDDRIARERAQQEKLRRLARSLAVGVVVASVLALIAIGMGGYALMKREQANKAADLAKAQTSVAENATKQAKAQTRIATSRQLAALAVAERDKYFERSLLLAVEAFRVENTFEARERLYQSLQERPGLTSFLHLKEGPAWGVAFSPDGKTIAAGYGGGLVLWDVATCKRLVAEPLYVTRGLVDVAFSPDGKTLAAGCGGGVMLWELAAPNRLVGEPLLLEEGDVRSVAFSPDGKTIAAGFVGVGRPKSGLNPPPLPGSRIAAAFDGSGMVLWDLASRKRLVDEPLPVKEGDLASVTFSPDGRTIAAGCRGGVVLWDVAARKRLSDDPLPVKRGGIQSPNLAASVAFSPDGKTIAAVCLSGDFGVVLWDVTTCQRLVADALPVREGPGSVAGVAFSPDGKTIAAGYRVYGGGGGVVLWDLAARIRLVDLSLSVKEGEVASIAFSSDGKTIAAGYHRGFGSGGVVLWDLAARKRQVDEPLSRRADEPLFAKAVSMRPAERRTTFSRLVDEPLFVKEGYVGSVTLSPDGKTIAAGYNLYGGGSGVVLWDLAARKRLADVPLPVIEGSLGSVAFSPDGKTLAAGCHGGVVLWDLAARKRLADDPLPVKGGDVESVAFSPDGKTLAAGYRSGVVLWDLAARKRLVDEPLPVKEGDVRSVAFSPDGKTLAAGYRSGVVLWDLAARKRLVDEPLPVKEGDVESVVFSPDAKTLAAGCRGGVVLWDLAARKRLADDPLSVKEGDVESVAFSPDGKTIAAGGYAGVVLWDVTTRQRLVDESFSVNAPGPPAAPSASLPKPVDTVPVGGRVASLVFSPDGKTIAAGCGGGVLLWDVDLESWRRRAGRIANRNFTREEWREYFPETPYHATFPELPIPSDEAPVNTTPPPLPTTTSPQLPIPPAATPN